MIEDERNMVGPSKSQFPSPGGSWASWDWQAAAQWVGGGVGWDNNVHVSLHTDALICTAPSSYSWCGVWGGVWVGARRLFR